MQPASAPLVLFEELAAKQGELGIITLNRPEALNALSYQMLVDITNKLNTWKLDPKIHAVIIKSNIDKAFSAGGDIKQLYHLGAAYVANDHEYFRVEYLLNLLIKQYPKPYISLLNGIAMGGGLGIAINGHRMLATENIKLAMPETAIGIYPDAGASYFLSHCPDHLGMYLGLTGNAIGLNDALFCELVHAFIPSHKLAYFVQELTTHDLSTNALSTIDEIINAYQATPGSSELASQLKIIRQCFSLNSVEAIMSALEQQESSWAAAQLSILKTRSPSSLKVTHKLLTISASKEFAACLEQEFNLTINILQTADPYEGIRAVLIDKTNDTKWQPARLQDVADSTIDKLFEIKCKL